MEEKIKQILDELGITKNLRGYYLWIDIISYVKSNYKRMNRVQIMKIYNEFALRNDTNSGSIERNLRYCIEYKYNKIKEYFDYPYNITNKVFLMLCVEKLKGE